MIKLFRTNLHRNRSRNQHLNPVNCSAGLVNTFKTATKLNTIVLYPLAPPLAHALLFLHPIQACSKQRKDTV